MRYFDPGHVHAGSAPVLRLQVACLARSAQPGTARIDMILNRAIHSGGVFDWELPQSQMAEGWRAMDERRAIKTLLIPES